MTKVLIYGTGNFGTKLYEKLTYPYPSSPFTVPESGGALLNKYDYEITGFIDSNPQTGSLIGLPVVAPDRLATIEYDKIVIASFSGFNEIKKKLVEQYRVPEHKIDGDSFMDFFKVRITFLRYQSKLLRKVPGSVAEAGVFRGDFARFINLEFPDRTLYLFDTFEGHTEGDIQSDATKGRRQKYDSSVFENTNLDYVRSIMPNPDKIKFRVGWFPVSAEGIEDIFAFVNLDLNLYTPTIAGLEFFVPKMSKGGVILIHDYFEEYCSGVKQAVDEYCDAHGMTVIAIGDEMSVAIIC
jgi:hypothetical protein